jgi:hypothetical protein
MAKACLAACLYLSILILKPILYTSAVFKNLNIELKFDLLIFSL